MRVKTDGFAPSWIRILDAMRQMRNDGQEWTHGYQIAALLKDVGLLHRGTLYKALERLEARGHIESRWEEPKVARRESRPSRRYYRLLERTA